MARTLNEVKGHAEGLLFTTEMTLREYGHVLEEEGRTTVWKLTARLRAAVERDDAAAIEEAIGALEAASHLMAERMVADADSDPTVETASGPRLPLHRPQALALIFDYLVKRAAEELGAGLPLAAVLDGEIGLASFAVDDADRADVPDLLGFITDRLRAGALQGRYTATGTCALVDPSDGERDALLFQLDHEDGTSLTVTVRFTVVDGVVEWGRLTEREGPRLVFLPS